MKLYQLLQSFEFEEIFPTVNVMFPNAQLHRDIFEKAFDMLCNIQPSPHGMYAWERKSKKAKALISMM